MKILEIISKMDFKTIVIIVLLAICAGFFYNWLYTDTGNGEERKRLERENQLIKIERKKLETSLYELDKKFKRDSLRLIEINSEIIVLNQQLNEKDEKLNRTLKELEQQRKVAEDIRKKIKDLEQNQIKRKGVDLLESLEEKTKQ